jgi:hypothetical protein
MSTTTGHELRNLPKPEARLKARVIDRLISSSFDNDTVLISEMVVANWARRADLVLANGKLCAFEVKSEQDTLSRLDGQLADLSAHFEKVVVVAAGRFEEQIRSTLPPGVGLWIQGANGEIRERVRARTNSLSKEAAIGLMTATELRRLLTCNGQNGVAGAPRHALAAKALGLPASDLASAARDAIKRRFRARHVRFVAERQRVGTLPALGSLARPRIPVFNSEPVEAPRLPSVVVPSEHPLLVQAPAGPVLKRLLL